jgi:hypothetical protein
VQVEEIRSFQALLLRERGKGERGQCSFCFIFLRRGKETKEAGLAAGDGSGDGDRERRRGQAIF